MSKLLESASFHTPTVCLYTATVCFFRLFPFPQLISFYCRNWTLDAALCWMRTEDSVGYSHLDRVFFSAFVCLITLMWKKGHITNLVMFCALCDPGLNQALFNNGRLRWKPCSVACFLWEWLHFCGSRKLLFSPELYFWQLLTSSWLLLLLLCVSQGYRSGIINWQTTVWKLSISKA